MISLPLHVSHAMEFATSHSVSVDAIASIANILREETMDYRNWKFTTNLDHFSNPPMLQFFLNQYLFGPHSKKVTGRRDTEVQSAVDVSCQFMIQNLWTDRQVKHAPKKYLRFRSCGVETPLSIAIHSKS